MYLKHSSTQLNWLIYGQLKTSDPKSEGFSYVNTISNHLYNFYEELKTKNYLNNYVLKAKNVEGRVINWGPDNDFGIYKLTEDGDITTNKSKRLYLTKFQKL